MAPTSHAQGSKGKKLANSKANRPAKAKSQLEPATPKKSKRAAPKTTRTGRAVKNPRVDDDFIYGSELDREFSSTPAKKRPDSGESGIASSPPISLHIFQPHIDQAHRSRPPPADAVPQSATPAEGGSEESAPNTASEPVNAFTYGFDENVDTVINSLLGAQAISIELPDISNAAEPDKDVPYTTAFLTQLYVVCYNRGLWDICDLVVDTWIRAFHAVRSQTQKNPDLQIWRPNRVLEARMKVSEPLDEFAPNYHLTVEDPVLDPAATSFDISILNVLYDNTTTKCGARLLWADAMTLAGSKTDKILQKARDDGKVIHQDLVYDIACTSLRMVRRKLTLKIEEDTEQAWCERYHEHNKHEKPCYRELAWKEGQGDGGAVQMPEEEDGYESSSTADGDTPQIMRHVHFMGDGAGDSDSETEGDLDDLFGS